MHPRMGGLRTPAMTKFEEVLLAVLVAVMKGVKFKTDIPMLLDELFFNMLSEEKMLPKRIALW